MALTTIPVREVIRATPRTRLLRLDLNHAPFTFKAGQAVMAGLHGSPLRKPYSIASAPSEAARACTIELLVQVDESGGPDPHLELARPGTALDIEGPFGTFGLPAETLATGYLMVAGGTGIAPLRSMLVEALDQAPAPALSVVYSARSPEDLAYRAELESFAHMRRLSLVLTVTRDEGQVWSGRRGRVDEELLRAAMPSPDATCIVCGPPTFVEDVRERLQRIGVSDESILVERYDA